MCIKTEEPPTPEFLHSCKIFKFLALGAVLFYKGSHVK